MTTKEIEKYINNASITSTEYGTAHVQAQWQIVLQLSMIVDLLKTLSSEKSTTAGTNA